MSLMGRQEPGRRPVLLESLADSSGRPGTHPALLTRMLQAVRVSLAGGDESGR